MNWDICFRIVIDGEMGLAFLFAELHGFGRGK